MKREKGNELKWSCLYSKIIILHVIYADTHFPTPTSHYLQALNNPLIYLPIYSLFSFALKNSKIVLALFLIDSFTFIYSRFIFLSFTKP